LVDGGADGTKVLEGGGYEEAGQSPVCCACSMVCPRHGRYAVMPQEWLPILCGRCGGMYDNSIPGPQGLSASRMGRRAPRPGIPVSSRGWTLPWRMPTRGAPGIGFSDGHGAAIVTLATPRAETFGRAAKAWACRADRASPRGLQFHRRRCRVPLAAVHTECCSTTHHIIGFAAIAFRPMGTLSSMLHAADVTLGFWIGSNSVEAPKLRGVHLAVSPFAKCRTKMMGGKCGIPDWSRSGKPRADLNRDRWIRNPES
jgi:hypothetical protein